MTDIEIATNLMQGIIFIIAVIRYIYCIILDIHDSDEHPVDARYNSLKAKLEVIDEDSEEFKTLAEYVERSKRGKRKEYK